MHTALPKQQSARTTGLSLERWVVAAKAARIYALVDQGSTGAANVVAFALLGRALNIAQFGVIGTMIGIQFFVAGFHRSAVVLPFTTDHRVGRSSSSHQEDSGWWWLGVGLTLLLSMATAAAGFGVMLAARTWPSWRWMVAPLLLAAAIATPMLVWEFARRWLYKIDRAGIVALCSLAYLLLLIAGAWMGSRLDPIAPAVALAWIIASLGALAFALPVLKPAAFNPKVAGRLARINRADAGWLAATNLPYSIYSSASVVVLIGIMVGPVAAALFSAARTITNPAISIVSAIDSIDKPRAARAYAEEGLVGLRRVVARSRFIVTLTTGAYLGLVAVTAGPLIRLIFHGRYAGLITEVRLLALGFFLFGLNLPSETMLIVLRAGRTMLAIRTVTAIATVAGLALAASYGITGMAIAYAITQAANFLLLRRVEGSVAARHHGVPT